MELILLNTVFQLSQQKGILYFLVKRESYYKTTPQEGGYRLQKSCQYRLQQSYKWDVNICLYFHNHFLFFFFGFCRISITFRKMDDSKMPYRFLLDPELDGIKPLDYSLANHQRVHYNDRSTHHEYEPVRTRSNNSFVIEKDDFPPLGSSRAAMNGLRVSKDRSRQRKIWKLVVTRSNLLLYQEECNLFGSSYMFFMWPCNILRFLNFDTFFRTQ